MNWITNTLLALGLTRDSWLWFWSRLVSGAGIIAAAGPFGMLDPYFGPDTQKWIIFACVIVLWLAGKYDTSPLPAAKVAPRNFHGRGSYMVLVAVLGGSVVLTGCASIPRIQPLPEHVAMADTQVRAVTGNLQQLLTLAAKVVDDVSRIEDAAATSGAIPASVDAQFDAAMLAYVAASERASHALVSGGLTTWPELRALVEPVLARGQALIDAASDIGAIRTRVQAFLVQLRDLLSAAAGEFLMGGAR